MSGKLVVIRKGEVSIEMGGSVAVQSRNMVVTYYTVPFGWADRRRFAL